MSETQNIDVCSVSNFHQVITTQIHLSLRVDFDNSTLSGFVQLSFRLVSAAAQKIVLDVLQLQVKKVTLWPEDKENLVELPYEIHDFTSYGSGLHIPLPAQLEKKEGTTFSIRIEYQAGEGPALTWLTKEQTAGKNKPYLFTQGQAALNRSFFPCQDSPAVKAPYSAHIYTPKGFTSVMSASTSSKEAHNDTHDLFKFEMKQPISSYLVALATGDLVSAPIGPRSQVWAEPCEIDKAKREFEGVTEQYISTAERLFGPYVWDKYDILVMPPSFPFGGMENPCLTFVTPTLLVGDRSLCDVIIHEIIHSWFGNLVTNRTWNEFWLNEGFTMYAQRRVSSELLGHEYTCLETATGLALLTNEIQRLGTSHPLTKLKISIEKDINPDDTYNEVPYEKGFSFVSYLRSTVESDKEFDAFLTAYVKRYAFQTVTSADFIAFFFETFPKLKESGLENKPGLEFDLWINQPGLPPHTPDLSPAQKLTQPANELAAYWLHWKSADNKQPPHTSIKDWPCQQICYFIDRLLMHNQSQIPTETLDKLDETYHFSQMINPEVKLRWSRLTIENQYDKNLSNVLSFLTSQGKQKYQLPIYRSIAKSGSAAGKHTAKQAFALSSPSLHANVRNYINQILQEMSA